MCQNKCRFFGFNPRLKKCRVHWRAFTSGMSDEIGWRYYSHDSLSLDCSDLRDTGHTNSGVYKIYPNGNISLPVRVYCNMETMDGGWTVIQKRINGSLSFDQMWTDYKNGFGTPDQDVWIGNDIIHQLTKEKNSYLYVSITLVNGTALYELYNKFSISDEAGKYQLFLAGPATGTLGDSMLNTGYSWADQSGMYFTTPDRDNDGWSGGNCGVKWSGGWWFHACYRAYLNGQWYSADWSSDPWGTISTGQSVRETMMMIRRH
ncbi:fibroleukin-like [Saccostrea echinata]|uniref:fibroleukin-like n=1 Tax=Saccostrea echinata TaxID=191078 RepID=UPI002A7FDD2C|nr:fibroleukin-like [Saccostrea echinata]